MKIVYRSLFAGLFLLLVNHSIADNYPKNFSIDILHYRFELTLSDDNDIIVGKTTVRFKIKKADVTQLRLDLVNPKEAQGKGMTIDGVYLKDKKLTYTHQNNEVFISLDPQPKTNEELEIVIEYHGVPADGLRIGATKYGDRSFFNENWPNRARHWLPVVDHPYDKATSEFVVKAPVHYQVISNGLLMEETILDSKTKLTHWKQSVPVSSWLYVLGVAEFAVQYVDTWEGKSIQTWVYNKDRAAGFYDFAEPTKQVLGFFSDYVGPCAYEKMANVQTPSVKGGMETSSAIFYDENLIDGKRSTRLRNVVIHELAHQWFGNAVTETTWDESWLSEGFATYFTMLFIEHAYGREELVAQLQSSKATALKFISQNPDYKIIDDRSPEKTSVTSALTYQKGAWVLHMLRNKIGDVAFKKGIQNYYRKYLNANATTEDFRQCMENVSGQNLELFFNQWLRQGSALTIQGTWSYDEKKKIVTLKLKQTQTTNFSFDIEVGVYPSGKNIPDVSTHAVNSKEFELTIPSATRPDKVALDTGLSLFAVTELKEIK
ncbi:MAG TPA: hypothetical protein DGG95_04930 [Cytophagales bacterium]|jgi:aminopeptidase N|nr:hypothetical protein [Cytophagales bacterium]